MALDATSDVLSPFLRLPREIHFEIVGHLTDTLLGCRGACGHCKGTDCEYGIDWSICQFNVSNIALLSLRNTCRYFRCLIPVPSAATLQQMWLRFDARALELYVCKYCERLRHRLKFTTPQQNLRRAFKYCADCAFSRPALYGYGNKTKVDGELWVSCLICRQLKKGEEAGVERCRRLCRQCCQDRGCQKQGTRNKCFGTRVRKHAYSGSPGFAGAWLRSQAYASRERNERDNPDEDGDEEDNKVHEAEWKAWFD